MPENTVPPHNEKERTGPLAQAAAKLPEIVENVDRIAACWRMLANPKTPNWKRVLVGAELIRLTVLERFRKPVAPPRTSPTTEAPEKA